MNLHLNHMLHLNDYLNVQQNFLNLSNKDLTISSPPSTPYFFTIKIPGWTFKRLTLSRDKGPREKLSLSFN